MQRTFGEDVSVAPEQSQLRRTPVCQVNSRPGYFNRFFKRLTGVAPGAYRQTIATARSTIDTPSFAAWP